MGRASVPSTVVLPWAGVCVSVCVCAYAAKTGARNKRGSVVLYTPWLPFIGQLVCFDLVQPIS